MSDLPAPSVQFTFVLVEPGEAGNIGAAARAMNTMGFGELRLVRPQADHLSGLAKAFAHRSEHLLEQAGIFETLADAIADTDLACASTARHRLAKYHYVSVRDLPGTLQAKSPSLQRVALVFGSERSGLSNADIQQCDLVTTIPQVSLQPSLNLAQAIMIYSFTLSAAHTQVQIQDQRLNTETMPVEQYTRLKSALQQLLTHIGLSDRYQAYIMQALARLGYEDLYLIQNIRTLIERKLMERKLTEKKLPEEKKLP
ncbi:MAG: TrmH family RNA methyltransferase [Cyanobacteria bacterium J06554_11]